MFRIDNATASNTLDAPTVPGVAPDSFFTDGNPGLGVPATIVDAEWMNMIQEEISNVIEDVDAGNTPLDKADRTQLKQAITAMINGAVGGGGVGNFNAVLTPFLKPVYINATTWQLPAGFAWRDRTNTYTIEIPVGGLNVDISTSGLGGLDTGVVAVSTPYTLYLIGDDDGILDGSAVWSAEFNEAVGPTLPAGYDHWKKTTLSVVTDSAGNFTRLKLAGGWPYSPQYLYDVKLAYFNTPAAPSYLPGATSVLSQGQAVVYTDVNCQAFMPPDSREASLYILTEHAGTGTAYYNIKEKGGATDYLEVVASTSFYWHEVTCPTDTAQTIQYQQSFDTGGGLDNIWIDIRGYRVTEGA